MVDNREAVKVGEGQERGVEESGDAEVHDRKKVHCAPSSTPRTWETKDGGHRSWMRTDTPSVLFLGNPTVAVRVHLTALWAARVVVFVLLREESVLQTPGAAGVAPS